MINGVAIRSLQIGGLFLALFALSACQSTASRSPDSIGGAESEAPGYDIFPADVILTCPEPEPVRECPPLPEPVKCPVCPKPVATTDSRLDGKLLVGELEMVTIAPPGHSYRARIDTGATGSSIHAANIVEFERDGESWVRFDLASADADPTTLERKVVRRIRVRQAELDDFERRVVVLLNVTLGSLSQQLEMSLTDRSGMEYSVLIGRNFLRNTAIVDVSQQMIAR
ncbi:MAG: RimK/LysX family protein [Porticoccaceae bacterium]|nr:RimK/LysX family protein [Porticoccaceae bacterium]